ncbi:PTS sugar transporter subunit IIA [Schumannella sp. 10F1B-5-1]|uniref:PTS sugar transporter subunit IIA n=1 Tax=Schumannella sp. 10F1B-5-1 TaxID=2590780 RepID=UPI0011305C19|nr:PTS sugar transporter subunit IIA [Schumannella sp. 10F1B-5-1]TPW73529.1 PTS sugar transporter subunit IIA [Schumannella sp. 10F1B-5-1]
MALPPLDDAAIVIRGEAADWRAAVRLAGAALARTGAATPAYADQMVRMIDEHGPYAVISPGLALAHARPGPDVLTDGLSVVTLAEPVAFGHPQNDPVRVVLGLAVATPAQHLSYIADLANAFNDSDTTERLAAADDADAVRAILAG